MSGNVENSCPIGSETAGKTNNLFVLPEFTINNLNSANVSNVN